VKQLRIVVSRHSAFYSPLIATLAGGFLNEEGLDASYRALAAGESSHWLLARAEADIIQSAVSTNWAAMERGESNLPAHFAQINCRDGFFLVSRRVQQGFSWRSLEGATLLADHAFQPLAMLKYAGHCQGVDWTRVRLVDAGPPDRIAAAFRAGEGDYAHLQGPAAQQIECEGAGHVVADVGRAMPPVAFSSLMATRDFLARQEAAAFMRAYLKARQWVRTAPAKQICEALLPWFAEFSPAALEAAIQRYQLLGCWEGGAEIPRDLYEQALTVFLHSGAIKRRWPYEVVVAPPPGKI